MQGVSGLKHLTVKMEDSNGILQSIRTWWDKLLQHGPAYGYFPNASKSWLIVKDAKLSEAHAVFQGSGIPITSEGKRYLGAVIGSESFIHSFVSEKVSGWITDIELLSQISFTQPHSAYAAVTHVYLVNGHIFAKQYSVIIATVGRCHQHVISSSSHWSKHIQLPTQRFVSATHLTWWS